MEIQRDPESEPSKVWIFANSPGAKAPRSVSVNYTNFSEAHKKGYP